MSFIGKNSGIFLRLFLERIDVQGVAVAFPAKRSTVGSVGGCYEGLVLLEWWERELSRLLSSDPRRA
jgi:hypothetical protein